MAAIRIEALAKYFGTAAAVADLTLEIADGAFVTLLGPSGCGKTTTLRMLAGYVAPDRGSIAVGGRILSSPQGVVPPEERGMGMVFQNYAVWPHKTVYENVVFGLTLRRLTRQEARRRVEHMLDLVNLSGLEDRYPAALSGGQQQRVALARSLVVEPAILLLDEPLSNLDAKLRERMRSELKALQRRTGITFVYVTHDQAEAMALSDRIAVLDRGRLLQYDTPRAIYAGPASRTVADFMGLINLLPARIVAANAGGGMIVAGPVQLQLPLPAGIGAGASVELGIRPEAIRLVADPSGAIPAQVEEQLYLGNLSEYRVALEDGTKLRVQAPAHADFPVGCRIGVTIDAESCSVFPSDGEE